MVSKYSFAFEKHFELKNFVAENGEGCAHFILKLKQNLKGAT